MLELLAAQEEETACLEPVVRQMEAACEDKEQKIELMKAELELQKEAAAKAREDIEQTELVMETQEAQLAELEAELARLYAAAAHGLRERSSRGAGHASLEEAVFARQEVIRQVELAAEQYLYNLRHIQQADPAEEQSQLQKDRELLGQLRVSLKEGGVLQREHLSEGKEGI